jgi:hypothetical protein
VDVSSSIVVHDCNRYQKISEYQKFLDMRMMFLFTNFRRKTVTLQRQWRSYLAAREEAYANFEAKFIKAERKEALKKIKKMDAMTKLEGGAKGPSLLSMDDRLALMLLPEDVRVRFILFVVQSA